MTLLLLLLLCIYRRFVYALDELSCDLLCNIELHSRADTLNKRCENLFSQFYTHDLITTQIDRKLYGHSERIVSANANESILCNVG